MYKLASDLAFKVALESQLNARPHLLNTLEGIVNVPLVVALISTPGWHKSRSLGLRDEEVAHTMNLRGGKKSRMRTGL